MDRVFTKDYQMLFMNIQVMTIDSDYMQTEDKRQHASKRQNNIILRLKKRKQLAGYLWIGHILSGYFNNSQHKQ